MTAAQFQTQFSMWAMLAAPLMISDDLTTIARRACGCPKPRGDRDRPGPGRESRAGCCQRRPATARRGRSRCRRQLAVALLNRGSTATRIQTQRERHRPIVSLQLRVAQRVDTRYELDQRLDRRRGAAPTAPVLLRVSAR